MIIWHCVAIGICCGPLGVHVRLRPSRWPELFAEAVEIDARMRGRLAFAKEPYLHPRRIPLAEAVRLDQAELGTGTERDGFVNKCEGHCGV